MEAVAAAEVARIYRAAAEVGSKPVKAICEHFGVSRATAHRWIDAAIAAGHEVRFEGAHRPATARWADGSASWRACRTCRTPWPCADEPG